MVEVDGVIAKGGDVIKYAGWDNCTIQFSENGACFSIITTNDEIYLSVTTKVACN